MKLTAFGQSCVAALAVLITLRGVGVIAWPWLWVLGPVWLPGLLVFALLILVSAMNGVARMVERFRGPWE